MVVLFATSVLAVSGCYGGNGGSSDDVGATDDTGEPADTNAAGDSDGGTGEADGSTDGGSDGESVVDADSSDTGDGGPDGGGDDGGTDGEADTGGPPTGSGYVELRQTPAAGRMIQYLASAGFSPDVLEDRDRRCESRSEGACTFRACDVGTSVPDRISAGEVAITGGTEDITLVYPETETHSSYYDTGFGRIFDGSHTLDITAEGDEVPAFSAELEPPSGGTLTAPTLPPSDEDLTVDTSSDLAVEWTTDGIDGGKFYLNFTSGDSYGSTSIECTWEATSGAESVPASLLADMAPDNGSYEFQIGDSKTRIAGDFRIDIRAVDDIGDGDDSTSDGSGSATFE